MCLEFCIRKFPNRSVGFIGFIIYVATKRYLLDVAVDDITRFEAEFYEFIDTKYPDIPVSIRTEKVITEATEELLNKAIAEFKADFK